MIIVYGWLSPDPTPLPLFPVMGKALSVRGYTLNEVLSDPELWTSAESDIRAGFEDGSLRPVIARRFGFEEIIDAQRFMESNQNIGKIVVVV